MATLAPACAKAVAMPSPIPPEPPVTSTRAPEKSKRTSFTPPPLDRAPAARRSYPALGWSPGGVRGGFASADAHASLRPALPALRQGLARRALRDGARAVRLGRSPGLHGGDPLRAPRLAGRLPPVAARLRRRRGGADEEPAHPARRVDRAAARPVAAGRGHRRPRRRERGPCDPGARRWLRRVRVSRLRAPARGPPARDGGDRPLSRARLVRRALRPRGPHGARDAAPPAAPAPADLHGSRLGGGGSACGAPRRLPDPAAPGVLGDLPAGAHPPREARPRPAPAHARGLRARGGGPGRRMGAHRAPRDARDERVRALGGGGRHTGPLPPGRRPGRAARDGVLSGPDPRADDRAGAHARARLRDPLPPAHGRHGPRALVGVARAFREEGTSCDPMSLARPRCRGCRAAPGPGPRTSSPRAPCAASPTGSRA